MKENINKSYSILNNRERFSTNVVERAIVFLSMNDDNFNPKLI